MAVAVDENLDERFRALIDADPALVSDAAGAQVVVGGAADGSLPAIELVTGNGIAIIHEDDLDADGLEELQARFAGTGLDRVGWKLGSDSGADRRVHAVAALCPGAAAQGADRRRS